MYVGYVCSVCMYVCNGLYVGYVLGRVGRVCISTGCPIKYEPPIISILNTFPSPVLRRFYTCFSRLFCSFPLSL